MAYKLNDSFSSPQLHRGVPSFGRKSNVTEAAARLREEHAGALRRVLGKITAP